MGKYASNTSVSVDKSRAEIESTIMRYGATAYSYGVAPISGLAVINFEMNDRRVRFVLELPGKDDPEFAMTPGGRRKRSQTDRLKVWEQSCRQRWRALLLSIKGKLEAAESGISTFEREFMDRIVMPNGQTVGEAMTPVIEQAYATRKMPKLLPGLEYSGTN